MSSLHLAAAAMLFGGLARPATYEERRVEDTVRELPNQLKRTRYEDSKLTHEIPAHVRDLLVVKIGGEDKLRFALNNGVKMPVSNIVWLMLANGQIEANAATLAVEQKVFDGMSAMLRRHELLNTALDACEKLLAGEVFVSTEGAVGVTTTAEDVAACLALIAAAKGPLPEEEAVTEAPSEAANPVEPKPFEL